MIYTLYSILSIISNHKGAISMNQKNTNHSKETISNLNSSFQNAHGPIPYGMTNDYMFPAPSAVSWTIPFLMAILNFMQLINCLT